MSVFNEKFQMKTQLEWDGLRNQFRKKQSILSVHMVTPGQDVMEAASSGTSTVIGDADFDLAYYANNPTILSDKLPLKRCTIDSKAYIEIYIKTNSQEVLNKERSNSGQGGQASDRSASPQNGGESMPQIGSRKGALVHSQLTQVDERTSEGGFKEVLDRKEFEYYESVNTLTSRIDDIKKITELTQMEISNIHKQNEDIEKNQQRILSKTYEIEQMDKKDSKLSEVLDILYKHESTLKFVI